jgi:putative hydroxymethylpyrimidine transport system substrate-binding protein
MRRTLTRVMLAAATVLALTGCGEKQDVRAPSPSQAQSLRLMLDWTPNADDVGLYEAIANGDFTNAGIHVNVQVPTDPATPLQLLQAGKVDVAISYEPELLLARDKGASLVGIGALVQRPLTSIVSLGDQHITSAAKLKGKTVGEAGIPYQHAFLTTILQHAGVRASSVHEVDVGANLVGSMLSGRVNATLGAFWNYEALELRQMGRRVNVIHVESAGVPVYDELVLVTTETELANHTNLLRRFVQALGRGYAAVRAEPAAGVASLVRADPTLAPRLQRASVQATLPSFFPHDPANPSLPWGWQDTGQWTQFGEWMLREHLISDPASVADAETNQLLAGQGP